VTRQPLFAWTDFQRITGDTLRPGGITLTARALDFCDLPQEAAVVDIGCGRGATARLLAARGHRVLALDPSEQMLSWAHAAGVLPVRGRAEALPLAQGSVDAVFCECVLSVTGAPSTVLAEAARVLRPGGWLVLSDLYRHEPGPAAFSFAAAATGQQAASATQQVISDKHISQQAISQQNALHQGDCIAGAMPLEQLSGHLRQAGFAVHTFEDHSRLLAELAGQLIFAGLPAAELCGCGAGGKPGYFLCLARPQQQ
jgi:SAM-dependent methyltransferase